MSRVFIRQITLSILAVLLLVLIPVGCKTTQVDPSELAAMKIEAEDNRDRAWESLMKNDWDGALPFFMKNIEKELLVGQSYRGTVLSLFSSNNELDLYPSLIKAVLNAPESPYTLCLLNLIADESPRNAHVYDTIIPAVESAAETKGVPQWLRREYYEYLYDYYSIHKGMSEKALSYQNKLHILKNWRFLGPFSNLSGQGVRNDYVTITPDQHNEFEEYKRGVNNWEIKPFSPAISFPGLEIPVSLYFSSLSYASTYAYTSLEIERDEDFMLVFARTGSIEAWLDGEKIIEDESYGYGGNAFYVRRRLSAGSHDLHLKISNLEGGASFQASMYPAEKDTANISMYYRSLFPNARVFDPFLNTICQDIESGNNVSEARFWLIQTLLRKGWPAAAYNELKKNGNEKSILSGWQLAKTVRALGDDSGYIQRIHAIATGEAFFAPAKKEYIFDLLADDRFKKADEVLSEIEGQRDEWVHALEARIVYHLKRDEYVYAADSYHTVQSSVGPTADSAYLMYYYSKNISTSRAYDFLQKFSNDGYRKWALLSGYRYFQSRNYSDALSMLETYLSLYPADEEIWYDYIDLLFKTKSEEYTRIRSLIDDLVGTFPISYTFLSEQKDLARAVYNSMLEYKNDNPSLLSKGASGFNEDMQKQLQEYKAALERILSYYPTRLALRDRIRELNDQPTILENNEPRDSYTIIEEYVAADAEYPDSDAVVVHDSRKEFFFGDGSSTIFQHYIMQVLTDRGVERNRYQYLEFHPAFGDGRVKEAFILKEDGRRIPADRAGRKLAFPGLTPGDFIILRYQSDNYVTGSINNEIWTSSSLASVYPQHYMEFQLVYPKEYNLVTVFHNIDEENVPLEKEIYLDDFYRMTIQLENTPRVSGTVLSRPWRDRMPWVDFSSIESWDKVSEWYQGLYFGQTRETYLLREITETLVSGIEDRDDKIKSIFDYVSAGIEYEDLSFQYSNYTPQTAESVVKEGYGDCKDQSALLIAMLRIAGIESYMVLNTPDYTGPNHFLPSPRFTHAIVAVPEEGNILYLDPTTTYFTYKELPADMVGSYILPIKKESELIRLEAPTLDQRTYYMLEMSNILGETDIEASISYQGIPAGIFRSRYRGLVQSDREEYYNFILNSWLPGLEFISCNFENLEKLDFDPVARFKGTLPPQVTKSGRGAYSIELPWVDVLDEQVKTWLTVPAAKDDLYVHGSMAVTPIIQTTVVHIPEGYQISNIPNDEQYSYNDSTVSYTYTRRNNSVICTREVYIANQVVPVEESEEFRAFLRNAIYKEKDSVYIQR